MLDEFGWTRAGISGVFTLVMIVSGVMSILAGRVTDQVGPRAVMIACGLFIGLGYILVSQVQTLWHFYLFYGGLTGIGMSGVSAPLFSVVARWFVRRRALMTGIIVAGPALGISIMPLSCSLLISAYDWRISYAVLGSVILLITMAAGWFLRREPGELGLLPYGVEGGGKESLTLQEEGFPFRAAFSTRQFWLICLLAFSVMFLVNIVLVYLVTYAIELKISPIRAASILSVAAIVSIPARISIGGLADRIGNRLTFMICLILALAAFLLLLVAADLWTLYVFAALYGFGVWATIALLSPLVADFFGLRSHGTLYGFTAFFCNVGSGLGPLVVGYLFDLTGSYQPGFLLCLGINIFALLAIILLKPISRQ